MLLKAEPALPSVGAVGCPACGVDALSAFVESSPVEGVYEVIEVVDE